MLIVESLNTQFGLISVTCNYSANYVQRFHQIPGSRFDKENKFWTFNVQQLSVFENLFKGEYYYKTPRWLLLNEPMPDYTAMYKVGTYTLSPMKLTLYDYQSYGVKYMLDRLLNEGYVINADDVGLGKTPQALGCIQYLSDHKAARKTLILCRKSLRTQWRDDGFSKFTNMHAVVVEGNKKKRKKAYDIFTGYINQYNGQYPLALVANYHTVINDKDILKAMGFDILVIDEAHRVKARTGVMNKAIQKISKTIPYKMFLTGTPIMTNPVDIFGLMQIADKGYFGPWDKFERKHIFKERVGRFFKDIGFKHLDELRAKVQRIIIRRTEFEVDIELPDITTIRSDVPMDQVQLNLLNYVKETQSYYNEELQELLMTPDLPAELEARKTELQQIMGAMNAAPQAIANDPRLFFMSKSQALKDLCVPLVPTGYVMSPKTTQIVDHVKEITDAGHKVILFSKYERQARLTAFDLERELKIPVLTFTGKMADDARNRAEQLFKTTPNHQIMVGTDAMSEGLNFQMAKYVIHIDQADTPAIKTQRNGRIRRASSTFKHAYCYDMITLGSFDESRLDNLDKHQRLTDTTVNLDEAQRVAIRNQMATEAASP